MLWSGVFSRNHCWTAPDFPSDALLPDEREAVLDRILAPSEAKLLEDVLGVADFFGHK